MWRTAAAAARRLARPRPWAGCAAEAAPSSALLDACAPLSTQSSATHRAACAPPPRRGVAGGSFAAAATADGAGREADPAAAAAAFAEVAGAFDRLISAAYGLVAEGKPFEAEQLLREGAASAEEVFGEGAAEAAPILDQLAALAFMHDRAEEGREPARRAWEAVRRAAAEEGSAEGAGAAAAAAARYGAVLAGAGAHAEAAPVLAGAVEGLEAALAAAAAAGGGDADAAEVADKLAAALGEATFYAALCRLAALGAGAAAADVAAHAGDLARGLAALVAHLGERHPLTACALREHGRLAEAAVEGGRVAAADALLEQQVALHASLEPEGEQVAALLYQLGTWRYAHGDAAAAVPPLERCAALSAALGGEDAEEHALSARHRLGVTLAAAGRRAEARAELGAIAAALVERLGGADNPASLELDVAVALAAAADAREAGDAGARGARLAEAAAAFEALEAYGEDHVLVRAARRELEAEAARGGGAFDV
jgi:hypothetical protein